MKETNQTLTSVKVNKNLFEQFRLECIRKKFSIQKLTERSMYLYLTDLEFTKKIHNQTKTDLDINN